MTPLQSIASMPLKDLSLAYQALTGDNAPQPRSVMQSAILAGINRGKWTVAMAQAGATGWPQQTRPAAAAPAPAPAPVRHAPQAAAPAELAATRAAADRAEDAARQALAQANRAETMAKDAATAATATATATGQSVRDLNQTMAAHWTEIEEHECEIQALARDRDAQAGAIRGLEAKISAARVDDSAITQAIRDQVLAAWAPYRTVVETAGTQAQAVAVADAAPIGRASARHVFGLDLTDAAGEPLMFDLYQHPEAPAIDPCFIWQESIVRHLAIAAANGRNLWMGGPAGVGKTQTALQFAAKTGRMFRRFVFDRFSTRDDFLGATGLQNGSTVFEPGAVLAAYTTPGAVCLLDEVGMAQPGALSALNAFLERQAQVAYAGQVWHRAPGTMFLAASNDLTQGDPSGRYAGVQPMNVAFGERFSLVVPCTYLEPSVEADALVRHTGCTRALADHLVQAMGVLRSKVTSGDIIDAPSIRQMVAFIEAARVLAPADAWRSAIAARQPAESEAALAAVYSACIDESFIRQESAQ